MLSHLFRRDRSGEAIASSLYGAIVAQARNPMLYVDMGVPDSVAGRFEMVVLHLVLLTRRLDPAGAAARAAGQGAFDLFCRDMDRSLRELGVGDLGVPRRMREVGEAFFGRAAVYERGLGGGNVEALAEALGRTVFEGRDARGAARALAAYAIVAAERLGRQPEDAILERGPDFPEAGSFIAARAGP